MKRRLIAAAAIAALAALWGGGWFYMADRIEGDTRAWIAARHADGVTITFGSIAVTGFPIRWRLALDRPKAVGLSPGWTWEGGAVEAELLPWPQREVALRLPGEHRLRAGSDEAAPPWIVAAERPDGRAYLDERGRIAAIGLDLGDARVTQPRTQNVTRAGRAEVTVRPRRMTIAGRTIDALDLVLKTADVVLAAPPPGGLGPAIRTAMIDMTLKGRLTPGKPAQAVAAWRDDGGVVDVNRTQLVWGPLEVEADGTVTLDAQNRPLAAFSSRILGYAETIDALVGSGALRPREGAGAKIALNLLAREEGGRKRLELPVTSQDGRLYIGGIALLRVDPIRLD